MSKKSLGVFRPGWTKEAKLGKSFATLAINELPKPIQKKVIGLRDNTQWALQADNVLLIGPSGVGSRCSGPSSYRTGCPGEMAQATALVQLLQQAKEALDMGVMSLDKYRVLIIDDIGYAH